MGNMQLGFQTIYQTIGHAAAMRKDGYVEEALTILQNALSTNPARKDQAQLHIGIGDCYRFSNRTLRAMEAYQEGLKLAPDNKVGLIGLATCQIYEGQYKDASENIQRVFKINPGDHYAEKTQRLLEARQSGKVVHQHIYHHHNGHNGHAVASRENGHTNGFNGHASQIISKSETHISALPKASLAPSAHTEGLEQTIAQLKDKISLHPRNVGPREQLMRFHMRGGALAQAWDQAQEIRKIDSYNALSKQFLHQYKERPPEPEKPREPQSFIVKRVEIPAEEIAMDEITITVRVNGQTFEMKALVEPSDDPLRIELLDPAMAETGKKTFINKRNRGTESLGPALEN
jgi:tetratricopeptide (TPR) repeat protein